MGWISDRKMKTGSGIGGYNRNSPKNGAPLRKIVASITTSTNMFVAPRVQLECGHETDSWGSYRARCVACKKSVDGA